MFGLDIAALAALYFFVFYRKWKNRGKDVLLINTVMYLYPVSYTHLLMVPGTFSFSNRINLKVTFDLPPFY